MTGYAICPDRVYTEVRASQKRKAAARMRELKKRAKKYGMFASDFIQEELAKKNDYFKAKPTEADWEKAEVRVIAKEQKGKKNTVEVGDWDIAYVQAQLNKPKAREFSGIDEWYTAAVRRDAVRKQVSPLAFQRYQDQLDNLPKCTSMAADYWLHVRLKLRAQHSLEQDASDFQAFLQRWHHASCTGLQARDSKRHRFDFQKHLAVAELIETQPQKAENIHIDFIVIKQQVEAVRKAWQQLRHNNCNIRQSILHKPVYPSKQQSLF